MLEKLANQFRKPQGILGNFVSKLMENKNSIKYVKLFDNMSIQQNSRLFEIGFGPGWGVNEIVTKFNCKVEGIDFSALMCQKARTRNKSHIQNELVRLFSGDFLFYNPPENAYDFVYCVNVVYFWKNLEIPFQKIHSMLKSTGEFHFYMASSENLDNLKFTKDTVFNKHKIKSVVETLKNVGFTLVNEYFDEGYYIKAIK